MEDLDSKTVSAIEAAKSAASRVGREAKDTLRATLAQRSEPEAEQPSTAYSRVCKEVGKPNRRFPLDAPTAMQLRSDSAALLELADANLAVTSTLRSELESARATVLEEKERLRDSGDTDQAKALNLRALARIGAAKRQAEALHVDGVLNPTAYALAATNLLAENDVAKLISDWQGAGFEATFVSLIAQLGSAGSRLCAEPDNKRDPFPAVERVLDQLEDFLSGAVPELDTLRDKARVQERTVHALGESWASLASQEQDHESRDDHTRVIPLLDSERARISALQEKAAALPNEINTARSRIRVVGLEALESNRISLSHARAVHRYTAINNTVTETPWVATAVIYVTFTLFGFAYLTGLSFRAGQQLTSSLGIDEFLAIGFGDETGVIGLLLLALVLAVYFFQQWVVRSRSSPTKPLEDVENCDARVYLAQLEIRPPRFRQYLLAPSLAALTLAALILAPASGYYRPEIDDTSRRSLLTVHREGAPELRGWRLLFGHRASMTYYQAPDPSGAPYDRIRTVSVPTSQVRCVENQVGPTSNCGTELSTDTQALVAKAERIFGESIARWSNRRALDDFALKVGLALLADSDRHGALPGFMEPFRTCATNTVENGEIRVGFEIDSDEPIGMDWEDDVRRAVHARGGNVDIFMAGFASETGQTRGNLDLSQRRLKGVFDRLEATWDPRPRRVEMLPFGNLWTSGFARNQAGRVEYPEENEPARSVVVYICSASDTVPLAAATSPPSSPDTHASIRSTGERRLALATQEGSD